MRERYEPSVISIIVMWVILPVAAALGEAFDKPAVMAAAVLIFFAMGAYALAKGGV